MIVVEARILIAIFGGSKALAGSFLIFIFVRSKKMKDYDKIVNHERIHFYQQLELLFVFHWLLYAAFYLWNRAVKGMDSKASYLANKFEMEAYNNEKNLNYLKERKPYQWINY